MKPKIKLLVTAFLCSISSVLIAQPVNINTAKAIAGHHLAATSGSSLKSAGSKGKNFQFTSVKATVENNDTLYYILNDTINKGFVIVSADKRAWPILAYSTEGNLNETNQPEAFTAWMENRKQEIESIKLNNLQPDSATTASWQNLNLKNLTVEETSVEPLIQTQWDQGCYYNYMCPTDTQSPFCGHVPTGCTITAMAQIMKYWNYPTKGTGTHLYNHSTYGNLSADFGSTTYQWSQMPNSVTSQNDAVATLMYHCGVSLDAEYGPSSTGAFNPRDALVQYFNYSSNAMLVNREGFTTSEWIQLLKSELDLQHPIWYTGGDSLVAHSFICDGYQDADYFHFNWGWSGSSDGYFYIGNLNTGWYSFNEYQSALIKILPGNLPDGYNGFFLSSNAVDIATKGGTTAVNVCSSANWTASSNQSWLSLSTNTGVSGKTTIIITATENNTGSDRIATVTISSPGFSDQSITVNQLTKVNVTPGGLKNLLSKNGTTITKLTLHGTIDARDFKTMRDAMPALTDVDLSEVTIVAYTGAEGTNEGTGIFDYQANAIPPKAFYIIPCQGQNLLKSITLPSTITSIESFAFGNSKYLSVVDIPPSVTNIPVLAFYLCSAFLNVDTKNPNYSSIDGVLFNKNQTTILQCPISKTGNYVIPSSVTTIGDRAFESCEKLTTITIPLSVSSIQSYAFFGCSGLTTVFIPSSVSSIESEAFRNCSALINVDANNLNYSSIDGVLFNKTQTKLIQCPTSKTGIYSIPSSVSSIGSWCFSDCSGLTGVILPSSVTIIELCAFNACYGLINITIPSKVSSIGFAAFNFCRKLESVIIPSSVVSIESSVFYNCSKLSSIFTYFISPVKLNSSPDVFTNVNKNTCILNVPYGSKAIFQKADQWKDFLNIVEMPGIFLSDNNLRMGPFADSAQIIISSSSNWTAISNQPWLNLSSDTGAAGTLILNLHTTENLTNLDRTATITLTAEGFPSQLITIKQICSYEVTAGGLNNLLGNDLATTTTLTLKGVIDARDFKTMRDMMPALESVDLSEVTIAAYTGDEGTSMYNTVYPANTIPEYAFIDSKNGKIKLTHFVLPITATSIGSAAFYGCGNLTNVTLSPSLQSMCSDIFSFCNNLKSIFIPSSVITIDPIQFFSTPLMNVDAANPYYSSLDGVLYNKVKTTLIHCPKSKNGILNIPPTVTIIGRFSFVNCKDITSISIPSSVNVIEEGAFLNCAVTCINVWKQYPIDLISSTNALSIDDKDKCTLNVPYKTGVFYRAANQWKDFKNIVEMPGFKLSATTAIVKAAQGSIATVDISSNVTYAVNSDQPWLAVTPSVGSGTNSLTFTATENSGNTLRTATVTVSATGIESQSFTVTQEGKNTTGIDQLLIEPEFIVYPNPTTGKAKLVFNQIPANGIFITISDITGKNCFKQLIRENESWLDLSGNVPGIYFIKTDMKKFKAEKVILK